MKQVTIEGNFKIVFEAPDDEKVNDRLTLENEMRKLLLSEIKRDELVRMVKVRVDVDRVKEIDLRDILGVLY